MSGVAIDRGSNSFARSSHRAGRRGWRAFDPRTSLPVPFCAALMLLLAACGDGGGPSSPPTGMLSGTLAYVVSECRVDKTSGYLLHQVVQIRHGDRDPITVMEVPDIGPLLSLPAEFDCISSSSSRFGPNSARRGAVQRLAVSADGATVAFELSDDFSIIARNFLPDALKGIFVVRADGSGLRRLGPPSRQASWVYPPGWYFNDLTFSPDGRTLTFPDLGPGPDGAEASQIFLQDVATGARAQITHLPAATPAGHLPPSLPSALGPFFLDDERVAFATDTNLEGANPQGESIEATVKRDGSVKVLRVVALPGSLFNPTFIITGDRPQAVALTVDGEPVNHPPNSGLTKIVEVFLIDGDNVLQLTSFRRVDTYSVIIGVDRDTVFFAASADPFGENPSEECQLFSIDRLGTNLRQLTHFHETSDSIHGCDFEPDPGHGCATGLLGQDAGTQAVLFYSSCDPLGTNPKGGQIFAMRPDGSGLRQLSSARGLVTEADGTVIGELPGPAVFSSPLAIALL